MAIDDLAFLTAFASSSLLLALLLASGASRHLQCFPPPSMSCWQQRTFRLLFRCLVAGLLVLSWHTFPAQADGNSVRLTVGVGLFVCGFGIATHATLQLGWHSAFGRDDGLRTGGWFRYSRNPIYVATWVGLTGWALVVPDPRVMSLLWCWAAAYVLALALEERWLIARYGESYLRYAASTPRFFGFPASGRLARW